MKVYNTLNFCSKPAEIRSGYESLYNGSKLMVPAMVRINNDCYNVDMLLGNETKNGVILTLVNRKYSIGSISLKISGILSEQYNAFNINNLFKNGLNKQGKSFLQYSYIFCIVING